jgi:NAD(P)-dependent dehydrogenase (short-subunit alcohol dehydrogenase family)
MIYETRSRSEGADVPLAGLPDKVVVVTGAASGLGRSVTERLLAEKCKVVAVDLDGEGRERLTADHARERLESITADVSSEGDTDRYFAAAVERFGRVDALHANSGIFTAVIERFARDGGPSAPAGSKMPGTTLADTDPEDFDRVIDVNTRGVFFGIRGLFRTLASQGGTGTVVTTSSTAGLRSHWGGGGYCASKAAVISLTQTAAIEGGPHGHRVNAVLPGPMATPLADRILAYLPTETRQTFGDGFAASIPLGRVGHPREVAALVAWLLSDESSFINGGLFSADGGQASIG